MKNKHFGVTQADIAHALNISRASVAIALNPKTRHKLLPETVAKIEAKASEFNYHPQRQARILRSGRSHTIGVVFSANTYHAPRERVRCLVRNALQAEYQLVSVDLSWFEADYTAAERYLLDLAVEGVVLVGLMEEVSQYWGKFIQKYDLPMVCLGKTDLHCDQAQFDMVSAFREMTSHHIGQGSRTLHLLHSFHDPLPKDFVVGRTVIDRVQGFTEAIVNAGGEVIADVDHAEMLGLPAAFSRDSLPIRGVVHYPLRAAHYENAFDTGYYETLRLLQSGKMDSLVCGNDDIATGAKAACVESGVLVPEQVKISGTDNAPFGRYGRSPLTTIEQPSEAMAQWCIRRIIQLIENTGNPLKPKQQLFQGTLIYRGSTVRDRITSLPSSIS